MSDAKENDEAGQNVPLTVEETQELVEAQVQLEDLAAPVSKGDTSNHVENGKEEVVAPVEDKIVKPEADSECIPQKDVLNSENTLQPVPVMDNAQVLNKTEGEYASDVKSKAEETPQCDKRIENDANVCQINMDTAETTVAVNPKAFEVADSKTCLNGDSNSICPSHNEPNTPHAIPTEINSGLDNENRDNEKQAVVAHADNGHSISKNLYFLDPDDSYNGNESGTEEEQSAFMKELENFFRERSMEFKPPKFYKEELNCLKLWRSVHRLGGYDKVTSYKLWRQVGESFKPPKTCTTVSWTFRVFYEKALLDYERHTTKGGELNVPITPHAEPINIENQCVQGSASSGRARRDAAARAMQGWHSQRLLSNGEFSDPIIKDRNSLSTQKREKQLKNINLLKRKKSSDTVNAVKVAHSQPSRPQSDTYVVDIGPPADWVKVNVQKTKDCFEVYALVPGLLREEVRVQSDPAGRLVISGEPENSDNPWGVTPFKKVVSLPSRIDTQQTSAVVTLHGQLFVRVPFERNQNREG
ncbi:AT-rich interactive domain-containing protein 5-like [Glycine soja]|uniref:AT-rich interactive domain-containing protein 3 isoform A n=1 Tax=Glycine soja TaxID=3848 RepID=A0A445J377_GLYSO|nr:AT-rich interactive domain-containing protein 5-like [Glycine soja]XP_028181983.1 AT-rich interactive domain-containing protein 5-like [Glycine soja]RZB92853.1 AT-rich interactive domain-containing protein 3 isoform A [Glycine soja]RZB92854.1 AT-rich interactive domain-containing protein 3 isoform B [Glycine soja]